MSCLKLLCRRFLLSLGVSGARLKHRAGGLGVLLLGCLALRAGAGEAEIRQAFAQRLPDLQAVDEVRATPLPGLWEVRVGSSILYSDQTGRYVFQGELIDIEQRLNLTKQRLDDLTAFDFEKLPFADALVWQRGDGRRKLVVFADPNCGYCKRLERELNTVEDITVYTFLIPILGEDSVQKSREILCAKDPVGAWRNWMVHDQPLPESGEPECDLTLLERNLALGEQHAVAATPLLVFANSERVAGALPGDELEKYFRQVRVAQAPE